MIFNLQIKPLSVNEAFKGRHFKTAACKQFENALRFLLPKEKVELPLGSKGDEYYSVLYEFHLKNFGQTDIDNCVKVLQDCIVKRGIIPDDRRIVSLIAKKFPSKKDWVKVYIAITERPYTYDHGNECGSVL